MSLSLDDYRMIVNATDAERSLLREISEKQDRQIKLLERIVSALENRQDDGR